MTDIQKIEFQVLGYTPVVISVGDTYFVKPLNPKKLKHRDREVQVTGFDDSAAKVKFIDNGKAGKVELRDLILSAGAEEV